MKNLKLSYRLSIGFGLILLLLVVIAGIGVARLSQQNQTMQHITEEVYPKANASQSISYMVVDMSRMVRNIILRSDAEGLASNKKTLDQTKTMIADKLALLDKLAISDKDREMNQRVRAAVAAYLEFTDSVVTPGLLNKDQEAIEILYGPRYATQGALLKTLKELVEFQEADMHSSSQHANEMYETAAQIMGLAAFISLVIGALSAWLITRSVTAPLGLAVIAADRVAEGDLNHRIEVNSTDETGRLLAALRGMQASLIDVVGSVRTGTHTIATASSQIAVGNQDLSSRTEQQASSLEQTAASLEELTSTVKLNEENARQANHLAVSASEIAAKGGVVVGKVVETMSTIESSSKKIMDIISVIDSIAFQTNILALNAAVEAARAGEQGRGFAVVASEVRNLAQRSGAAAKEIKGLIDASVINVSAGSALVGEAGRTMGDIVASITRVTNIMGEITTASREQTTGIEQINQAITQMDQVTPQNAALVEEAAAAAGSLQEQAQGLVKTVSIFKLDGK